ARTGESVCAVVVPAEGAQVTLEGLAGQLAAAGLRRQATPERLEIVDGLPRNPAGKVLKRELQQRFGLAAAQGRG
ncbi:MAG: cyclohexanecarboxylate-CoA ligase, partial [Acidimicrobiaceae bacterium]|nr:cyclohexanecarboxylate-CoA ligase [Acidimicrobiaceae bacterium]